MPGAPIALEVTELEDLCAGFERLVEFASRNGIRIPRTSRIAKYGATLQQLKLPPEQRKAALDPDGAVLELRQLVSIMDALSGTPELATSLRRLLDGNFRTLGAPVHDPGRDKQFELFVAARLAQGGLQVVFAEPDLRFDLCGRTYGIAAKRPRSAGGIASLLSKGRRQIRKAGGSGFVAIDASMYPIPDGELIVGILDRVEDVPRCTLAQLRDVITRSWSDLEASFMEEPERSGTWGVLFHLAIPYSIEEGSGLRSVTGEAWLLVPAKLRLSTSCVALVQALRNARTSGGIILSRESLTGLKV